MSSNAPRFVIVASTAGSVMNQALQNPFFKGLVHSVVVDRPCDAATRAREHGVPVVDLWADGVDVFCDALLSHLQRERIDFVLSFYTRFYNQRIRDAYQDRIVNLHPSILPAFKGMDGFGDQILYQVPLVGSTVELIDQAMDEGKIVMQTVFPRDPTMPLAQTRHRLFVQQCRSLIQTAAWLRDGRVEVDGRTVSVRGACFDNAEFSPALDSRDAIELQVADPSRG